jgi:pimeloyl-ACP methyl ester carboxylesterase
LIIPGGPADGGMFAPIADELASVFSVVTYDPRGISESTRDYPHDDVTIAVQADDARRLLDELGPEPAYVYGNSGGAVTGLELVTLFPGRVRALLAHEPPLTELLPDRDEQRALGEALLTLYREAGPIARNSAPSARPCSPSTAKPARSPPSSASSATPAWSRTLTTRTTQRRCLRSWRQ